MDTEYPSYDTPTEGVEYNTKEIDYNEIEHISYTSDNIKKEEFNKLGYTEWVLPLGTKVYVKPNQSSIYLDGLNIHWKLKNFPHQLN